MSGDSKPPFVRIDVGDEVVAVVVELVGEYPPSHCSYQQSAAAGAGGGQRDRQRGRGCRGHHCQRASTHRKAPSVGVA